MAVVKRWAGDQLGAPDRALEGARGPSAGLVLHQVLTPGRAVEAFSDQVPVRPGGGASGLQARADDHPLAARVEIACRRN